MSNNRIPIEIHTVDAFTKTPFCGNPAAVCIMDDPHILQMIEKRFPSDEEKESFYKLIAREMNLSETCFLWKIGVDRYKLRWFTPTVEVNLCGHATLASSHLLFSRDESIDKLFFETRSGELIVEKDNGGELLKMNFPEGDPQLVFQKGSGIFEKSVLVELLQNINLVQRSTSSSSDILDKIVSEIVLCRKTKKLLIVVKDLKQVLMAEPNEQFLLNMDFQNEDLQNNIRGISVSMPVCEMNEESKQILSNLSTDVEVFQIDYVTRYFSPWNGIKEDPVNGSSQSSMAPYYSSKLNKKKLICFQASKRTGVLFVEATGVGRVSIGGSATIIMQGTIKV